MSPRICPECRGTRTVQVRCWKCGSMGYIDEQHQVSERCPRCHGSGGSDENGRWVRCPNNCNNGYVNAWETVRRQCTRCGGLGYTHETCPRCHGTGEVPD